MNRNRFFAIGLGLLFIVLFVWAGRSSDVMPVRDWMLDAASPFFSGIATAADWMRSMFLGNTAAHIRELEAERTFLLAEIAKRDGLVAENQLLRKTLSLRAEGETAAIPASVIGAFRDGRDEFLIINRGTAAGVGVGDIIIDTSGALGGTVISVSQKIAKVILLSSASRSRDVFFPGRNLRAIARGANNRELVIELVPQEAELAVGDLFVAPPRATGIGKPILIGEVRAIGQAENEIFKTVRAVQLFDMKADSVIVLLGS